jgi:hypothetical protein
MDNLGRVEGTISHSVEFHDALCGIHRGDPCNCEPELVPDGSVRSEPRFENLEEY